MWDWLHWGLAGGLGLLSATALFFFTLTRGALLWRGATGQMHRLGAHVYPLYSNRRLMRLVDWQPVIAAILLFQYSRLVSHITRGLRSTDLRGLRVQITSCAFGNVMPRVVRAACKAGADGVDVVDLIPNELDHARAKLGDWGARVHYRAGDATNLAQPSASVHANVLFFLLHELPHALQAQAVHEAVRVLAPGGTLYLAEFHKPHPWVLRALSWTYFKVFEPYGLALWDANDPVTLLRALPGLQVSRHTVFFGNFQVITATRTAL